MQSNSFENKLVSCDFCEKTFEQSVGFLNVPSCGSLVEIVGGYDMFFDNLIDNKNIELSLCHNCTVNLINMIKNPEKQKIAKGGHPNLEKQKSNTNCCSYSWN